jgi:hypothetical protein
VHRDFLLTDFDAAVDKILRLKPQALCA